MNTILKQRLIGALILVALGVVFWPIIFVDTGDQAGPANVPMPSPPGVNTSPISAPDTAGLRTTEVASSQLEAEAEEVAALNALDTSAEPSDEDLQAAEEGSNEPAVGQEEVTVDVAPVPTPAPERPRTEAPAKPEIDAEGVPVAWILQVASVSTREKANALRDSLISDEHKAYVKQIRRADKTLYRVYIGPKFEKAQLERIKPSVDSEHGVSSLIVRYVP